MQGGARTTDGRTERETERERGACARAVTCITWRTCTAFVPRRVEISGVWFGDDWWGRGSKWSAALRAPRLTWPASPPSNTGGLSLSTFSSPSPPSFLRASFRKLNDFFSSRNFDLTLLLNVWSIVDIFLFARTGWSRASSNSNGVRDVYAWEKMCLKTIRRIVHESIVINSRGKR